MRALSADDRNGRSRCSSRRHETMVRCRHPFNTSVIEGINNTIKVIKRRASGYRDDDRHFLIIRAALRGSSR
nr:transposase [Paraburkholderia youngii]